ncbi:MAG: alpha-1,2-fucosyltransferase [Bacteroidota bacterium]
MVIIRLKGGMGNQLFQYALGRQLAHQLGIELRLEVTNLLYRNKGKDFVYRDYDLGVFNVREAFLLRPELIRPVMNLRLRPLAQLMRKIGARNYPVVTEAYFHYDPSILTEAQENVIYEGWFQSPKYFVGVEDQIREEFTFSRPVLPESRALLGRIQASNAVCLNVRRTDFLTTDVLNATNRAYFLRAADLLGRQLSEPRFFVFSDDVAWCRENITLDYPTEFVDHAHKGWKFGNYLRLMQACRHFIIPNSSFAWWAAWLNTGADKVVVAPENWFTDPTINTSDLVPETWLRT